MLGLFWRVLVGRFTDQPGRARCRRNTIQWRRNVLALVGMGYALTLVIFVMLVLEGNMEVAGAFEVVTGPLMALVGGSLAIAKDLIGADDEDARSANGESLDDDGNDQGSTDQGGDPHEEDGQ